jgi:hypothetical protein
VIIIDAKLWPRPRWDIDFWLNEILVDTPAEARGQFLYRIKVAAEREGFVGFIITGAFGSGKSTFAIKLGRAVYGSYDVVLRHCIFFKWEDLRSALTTAAENGFRYPYVVWDDAGVWAGRYLYRTGPRRAEEISAIVQLIRTQVACIVITSPSLLDLGAFLRERAGFNHIILTRLPDRLAKEYGRRPYLSHLVMGAFKEKLFRVEKEEAGEAVVDTSLPEDVYRRYALLRRKYILELQASMKENVENVKGKRKKYNPSITSIGDERGNVVGNG